MFNTKYLVWRESSGRSSMREIRAFNAEAEAEYLASRLAWEDPSSVTRDESDVFCVERFDDDADTPEIKRYRVDTRVELKHTAKEIIT